jgi:hypothetical protein
MQSYIFLTRRIAAVLCWLLILPLQEGDFRIKFRFLWREVIVLDDLPYDIIFPRNEEVQCTKSSLLPGDDSATTKL